MLLDLDKLGRDAAFVIDLPAGMKEQFIKNATEYFAVLERDIEMLTPNHAVDAISILASFQEYVSSTERWEGA